MLAGGGFVYEKIAKLCNQWNETPPTHPTAPSTAFTSPTPCVGLVAGATDLIALRRIRSLSPQIWILCPGVGAQGGEADVRTVGCTYYIFCISYLYLMIFVFDDFFDI
jgi:orotidine-5'-phosphate decarboxylase